jgi:hypothetical protein
VSEAYVAAANAAGQQLRDRLRDHERAFAEATRPAHRRLLQEVGRVDRYYGDRHQPVDKAYSVLREDQVRAYEAAVAPFQARRELLDAAAHDLYQQDLRVAQAAWDALLDPSPNGHLSPEPPGLRGDQLRKPRPRRAPTATVLVPYVPGMLRPQTRSVVKFQWPRASFVETPREDDESYARALIAAATRPGHLVVVEHDIVPPEGSIRALLDCIHPWCYHLVALDGKLTPATLGLAKFAAGLRVRFGDWMAEALQGAGDPSSGRLPLSCDVAIARWMERQGVPAHVHEPPPLHLHWKGYHGW